MIFPAQDERKQIFDLSLIFPLPFSSFHCTMLYADVRRVTIFGDTSKLLYRLFSRAAGTLGPPVGTISFSSVSSVVTVCHVSHIVFFPCILHPTAALTLGRARYIQNIGSFLCLHLELVSRLNGHPIRCVWPRALKSLPLGERNRFEYSQQVKFRIPMANRAGSGYEDDSNRIIL